jgi:hypothetical protein
LMSASAPIRRKQTFRFRPKPVIDANKSFCGKRQNPVPPLRLRHFQLKRGTETLPGRRLANKKLGLSPPASLTSIHGI